MEIDAIDEDSSVHAQDVASSTALSPAELHSVDTQPNLHLRWAHGTSFRNSSTLPPSCDCGRCPRLDVLALKSAHVPSRGISTRPIPKSLSPQPTFVFPFYPGVGSVFLRRGTHRLLGEKGGFRAHRFSPNGSLILLITLVSFSGSAPLEATFQVGETPGSELNPLSASVIPNSIVGPKVPSGGGLS